MVASVLKWIGILILVVLYIFDRASVHASIAQKTERPKATVHVSPSGYRVMATVRVVQRRAQHDVQVGENLPLLDESKY